MNVFKNLNGLQIVGIGFMLASILGNITNAATGDGNSIAVIALAPIGIALWLIGIQRAKTKQKEK